MNRKLLLAAIVVLIVCNSGLAQDKGAKSEGRKHKGKIETGYDKFQDITSMKVDSMRVSGVERLFLTVVFYFKGQQTSKPSVVTFGFKSYSSTWRFVNSRDLRVLADKERFDLGKAELIKAEILTVSGDANAYEVLGADVPPDAFLRIIKSQSVEMQLGGYEFALKENQLEALRNLASRIKQ